MSVRRDEIAARWESAPNDPYSSAEADIAYLLTELERRDEALRDIAAYANDYDTDECDWDDLYPFILGRARLVQTDTQSRIEPT